MEDVLHIIVKGRVQGVGFRFFTEHLALRYGVAGWVRNLPTGEVEIVARLPEATKAPFLEELRQGPPMARVTGLDVSAPPGQLAVPRSGFSVRS